MANRNKPRRRRSGDRARRNAGPSLGWLVGITAVLLLAGLVASVVRQAPGAAEGQGLDVGARIPALSLPSTAGGRISLWAYKGKRVVLYFYEGAGCGPCQDQLVELQSELARIRADGGEVVAASTDPLAISRSLAEQLNLHFPILYDEYGRLGSAFKIFDLTGGMNMGAVDRHSVFVINRKERISWRRVSLNQMHVPVAEILSALRSA